MINYTVEWPPAADAMVASRRSPVWRPGGVVERARLSERLALPGIGFEGKSDLIKVMRELAS